MPRRKKKEPAPSFSGFVKGIVTEAGKTQKALAPVSREVKKTTASVSKAAARNQAAFDKSAVGVAVKKHTETAGRVADAGFTALGKGATSAVGVADKRAASTGKRLAGDAFDTAENLGDAAKFGSKALGNAAQAMENPLVFFGVVAVGAAGALFIGLKALKPI